MITVTIFVLLLSLLILKYILHIRYTESFVKNIKSVGKFIPFFGHAFQLVGKSMDQIVVDFIEAVNRIGTPFKGYLGPKLYIAVDKPEDMKTVLTQCLDKPFNYGFFPAKLGLPFERCTYEVATSIMIHHIQLLLKLNPFKLIILHSFLSECNLETNA